MARARSTAPPAPRRRRLVVAELCAGAQSLAPRQAHYLRDVLRLAAGAEVELVDRQGRRAPGRVLELRPEVCIEVGEVTAGTASGPWLTVAAALPKGERADWAVEKLTELGVGSIVWLACARSVVAIRDGAPRFGRWQRLIDAAVAQSGVATAPELLGTITVGELCALPAESHLVADQAGSPLGAPQVAAAATIVLAVGPEGGFTAEERQQFDAAGFAPVSFAGATLRIETAAVVGAALALSCAGRERP